MDLVNWRRLTMPERRSFRSLPPPATPLLKFPQQQRLMR